MLTAPTEDPLPYRVGHTRQQIAYGREKGYVFGTFCPATGMALSVLYTCRIFAHGVNFLEQVDDARLPADQTRIDTILDNLSIHCAVDMLLLLTHSRWEFVFQPT